MVYEQIISRFCVTLSFDKIDNNNAIGEECACITSQFRIPCMVKDLRTYVAVTKVFLHVYAMMIEYLHAQNRRHACISN